MNPRILGRFAIAIAVVICGAVAWKNGSDRAGGTEEISPALARAPSSLDAGALAKKSGDGEQITTRLLDVLGEARITAPNKDRGLLYFNTYWRKMAPAFSPVVGENKKFAASVALRTSENESQWKVNTASGGVWAPDARVWNMSEGSFDQREAIFAPTPCTAMFHVSIPQNGSFSFAAGTVNSSFDATIFRVMVGDKIVFEERMLPVDTRGWSDRTVDLSEFSGQSVDLSLVTESSPRTSADPAPPSRPRSQDGGAPQVPVPVGGPNLALWGNPVITSKGATTLPYNVLFIVVDALRPDVIASFHDDAEDAAKQSAKYPPRDALLPKIQGLTPNLDALATQGVRFRHAYSGGAWTRPGTLAMLSGSRSSELGIDPTSWVLPDAMANRYYASDPPMLALLLRKQGVVTRAFVNNYFMVGYAPVGIDMGFERVFDHRFRTKDTALVTASTIEWMKAHKDERFFAFCNFNSPHEPWEPPARFLDRIPKPPAGPGDDIVRRYMAEAGKDDEAIGLLMQSLDELQIRQKTLVIVTADHGETLSADHDGVSELDHMRVRYHHAASNYEETTRIPILMSLKRVLPENGVVNDRIRNIDIAPTVLAIEGLEPATKMSGRSLLPLVAGQKEPDPRVVISEGRGTRGFIYDHYRLLLREGKAQITMHDDKPITISEELYDLTDDPGERHNIARSNPDLLKQMQARLLAAKANIPAADAKTQTSTEAENPRIRLRFAGGERPRRVNGKLRAGDEKFPATISFEPENLSKDSFKVNNAFIELAFMTNPDEPVGLDVRVDPPSATLHWELYLDDAPWPKGAVFAGPFGLYDASAETGLVDEASRSAAYAFSLPEIETKRETGLFVIRERRAEGTAVRTSGTESATEMDRMLKEWGYAHGKSK